MSEDGAMRPSQFLGRQVKFWRDRRKLTAQAVADRLAEIGAPALNRVALSKIEVGERRVSVDEWLQLAHALAVPPAMLLMDFRTGEHVALTPDIELHPWLMWKWIRGEEPPMVTNPAGGALVTRVEEFGQATTAIQLYCQEEDAANLVHNARSAIRNAEYVGDPKLQAEARAQFVEALQKLTAVLDEMVENGIEPPAKPAAWIEPIRELGMSRYPDRLSIYKERDENELRPVTKQDAIFLNAINETRKARDDGER